MDMVTPHSDSATGDGKRGQPALPTHLTCLTRCGVLTVLSLAAAGLQASAFANELAPGLLPNDAINVGQLNQVRANVNDVTRIAYSGTAMAVALSAAYVPTLYPGEKTIGLGVGTYKSHTATSLGFKALSEDGRMAWGMAVATTGSDWGLNAGIGWKLPRAGDR
ncbi:YadA-like family protein [Variovorax sp. VaC1]|uniref:YadA-like family protein n=1 Tax=Variovorax sp. VaC1 TaxID=3373132 RepID=UPI003747C0A3